MANLPDINTANVGIIAFWNAHDHLAAGADTIDPTDCTSIFTSYSVYDNGINGYVDPDAKGWGGSGRYLNIRVKNDGWIIAWIDRTNTFWYPTKPSADFGESGYKGYYDLIKDWMDHNANTNGTYSMISYAISHLYNALTNKASFAFVAADVGHYCYEFTNANVLTIAGHNFVLSGTYNGYFQYTSGTSIYHASVTGSIYCPGSGRSALTEFEGNAIAYKPLGAAGFGWGAADVIAEGWAPSALTDYNIKSKCVYDSGGHPHAKASMVVIWS
jgi:hypothetical protein